MIKDGNLLIHSLASCNCFTYRIKPLSKMRQFPPTICQKGFQVSTTVVFGIMRDGSQTSFKMVPLTLYQKCLFVFLFLFSLSLSLALSRSLSPSLSLWFSFFLFLFFSFFLFFFCKKLKIYVVRTKRFCSNFASMWYKYL